MSLSLAWSFILLFVSARSTNCPDSWVAFRGSCYKFGRDSMVFTLAEEYCQLRGGHLVHIETKMENTFIKTFLEDFNPKHDDFWIGMNDETVEGVWVLHGTNDTVPFTYWLPTEPQNSNNEDCAVIGFNYNYFGWADVNCFTNRRPICETSRQCPDSWVAFRGSCYKFGRDSMVFTLAEEYCQQRGGHLVHIETKMENMFIKTFLEDFNPQHDDFWIGMNDETVEGVWVLHGTNDTVPFTYWLPTEPQNSNNEDCAVIGFNYNYFGWADVNCFTNRRPICETRVGSPSTEITGGTLQ